MSNFAPKNYTMKFGTKAIHHGIEPEASTGAIMTPIFQTSTFVQEAPGKHKGYEYARSQNPTRTVLETVLAGLENGKYGLAFSSGMAATDTIIRLLNAGDEVLACNDMYGGTYRLFTKVYERLGITFKFIDMTDAKKIAQHFTSKTKLVWIETPTNPLLNIIDIKAVADMTRANKAISVVDNTFASPYLQNPLELGADVVMHSVTKYLGGHSDVIMGCAITHNADLYEQLKFIQKSTGAVPGPQDCFLVIRGVKTLHVRMQRHCENGFAVANFLKEHPKISKVNYPGLPDHPNHSIAKSQMKRGFGGMISFVLRDDKVESGVKFMQKLRIFSLAESLGGVESLVTHPASMTHASVPREERIKAGLQDALIRFSVGIEDIEDLIKDLEQALS